MLWRIFLPLGILFYQMTPILSEEEKPERQDYVNAENEADRWLQLVDQGQYAKSWEEASPLLREEVKKAEWVQLMEKARSPVGHVVARTLRDQETLLSLASFPPGFYRVLYYDTAFGEKNDGSEVLFLVQDPSGRWKVVTYQVN